MKKNSSEAKRSFQKTIKFATIGLFLFTLSCAKKDESKSITSRISPVAGQTGARSVDASSSQNALDLAHAEGVTSFNIETFSQPTVVNDGNGQNVMIQSSLKFNDKTYNLQTLHDGMSNLSVSQLYQANVDQFTMQAQGVCSDASCSVYYVIIGIFKNGRRVVQLIQKQVFSSASQGTSNYQSSDQFVTSISQLFQILGAP